jgi:hypothetical protein
LNKLCNRGDVEREWGLDFKVVEMEKRTKVLNTTRNRENGE